MAKRRRKTKITGKRNTDSEFLASVERGLTFFIGAFYHLPRIKMSYQRRGLEVYTVPAKESYKLTAMPYFMAREIAALWVYYLRPLASLVLPGRA
ncbi:MAG: hypothetical protein JSW47_04870 [Phycisphaerales bacterium]|nr:MAG: hypothetical protein JSW47_04870 [Phycisphaerales bacterium]